MSQDRLLQEAVFAELAWEPRVTVAHIGVEAKDGIVTPTGHVENYPEKRAAEHAAARVKGVKPWSKAEGEAPCEHGSQ